jgi:Protein of unknown function (DUF4232)
MHLLPASLPRRLAGAAAIASGVALVPAVALAAASAPAAHDAAAIPACATSGLVVWLNVPPGNDFAGGAAYNLEFTNQSGHACTLHGYPGVSAVSLSGRQLPTPAGWAGAPSATVTLASGATATAPLQVADTGDFGGQCFQRPPQGPGKPGVLPVAAGLRVYPPNQVASKVVPYPLQACAHTGPVWMHVGQVKAGGPPPGL